MSKLTMETLEKSYKENTTKLYNMYLEPIVCMGFIDHELQSRVENEMNTYHAEVLDKVTELGGDTEVVLKWMKEALNEVKIGDIIFDYIDSQEES